MELIVCGLGSLGIGIPFYQESKELSYVLIGVASFNILLGIFSHFDFFRLGSKINFKRGMVIGVGVLVFLGILILKKNRNES